MSVQTDYGKFSCTTCQRQYPWKPEYAGKKVKCKCGSATLAPSTAPNAAVEPSDDDDDLLGGLFELAEQEQSAAKSGATTSDGLRCPSCQADMLVGETTCPSCNFNLKTGKKTPAPKAAATGSTASAAVLAYGGMNKRSQVQSKAEFHNTIGGSAMTELYIPASLCIAGILAQFLLFGFDAGAWRGFGYAIPGFSIGVFVNLLLCFAGVFIASQVFEASLGSPGPAALKLTAICLLSGALGNFFGDLFIKDSVIVRNALASLVMLPLAWGGFCWLFQMEFTEARYCTAVVWIVNKWVVRVVVVLFLTGAIGGTSAGVARTAAIVRADEIAERALDANNAQDAKTWLAESTNHIFTAQTNDTSAQLVMNLRNAGATATTALTHSGESHMLIVTVPSSDSARKKIFSVATTAQATGNGAGSIYCTTKDEGQKYLVLEFGR